TPLFRPLYLTFSLLPLASNLSPMSDDYYRRRRCYCCWVVFILVLLGIVAGAAAWYFRSPLLTRLARVWVVDEPVGRADAILVLGGGVWDRPLEAARLYTNGYAPHVLVVDVQPNTAVELGLDAPEQDLSAAVLESKGVPQKAIATVGKNSASTYDDLQAALVWATTNNVKEILIPTDLFHTRRVAWTADRLFKPLGIQTHVLALAP